MRDGGIRKKSYEKIETMNCGIDVEPNHFFFQFSHTLKMKVETLQNT